MKDFSIGDVIVQVIWVPDEVELTAVVEGRFTKMYFDGVVMHTRARRCSTRTTYNTQNRIEKYKGRELRVKNKAMYRHITLRKRVL